MAFNIAAEAGSIVTTSESGSKVYLDVNPMTTSSGYVPSGNIYIASGNVAVTGTVSVSGVLPVSGTFISGVVNVAASGITPISTSSGYDRIGSVTMTYVSGLLSTVAIVNNSVTRTISLYYTSGLMTGINEVVS